MTDAIESVVQGQHRKGQRRKNWEKDGEDEREDEDDEEEEGEVEEDKEVDEPPEEQQSNREEKLGNLVARSKAGTGRLWAEQEEPQHFHG